MEFLFGLFILAMAIGVYFIPTLVAADRKVPNFWSIAVINAFLGWTLIGWVVALAMAVRTIPNPKSVGEASPPTQAVAPRDDTVGGIKELADLHERGLLTDDEFASAKARLLRP